MITSYYINDPVTESKEIYNDVDLNCFLDEFYYLSEEEEACIGLIDSNGDNYKFSFISYDNYIFQLYRNNEIMYDRKINYDTAIEKIKQIFSGILVISDSNGRTNIQKHKLTTSLSNKFCKMGFLSRQFGYTLKISSYVVSKQVL